MSLIPCQHCKKKYALAWTWFVCIPRTGSHLFTYRLLKFLCNFLYETPLAQIKEYMMKNLIDKIPPKYGPLIGILLFLMVIGTMWMAWDVSRH